MNSKWPQYEIPPVGMLEQSDIDDVASLVEEWKLESKVERDKWVVPVRNVCLDLFYCGESPKPADTKVIPNHIKNNCIRVKDVMLKEPTAVEVKPIDDGGGPLAWYWNGPQVVPQQMIDPLTGMVITTQVPIAAFGLKPDAIFDEQMVAEPMDEMAAMSLQQMAQQNGWPSNWIVPVDSKLLGDIYQKTFDCYWREVHANEWLDSFTMMMVKGGWETGHYQYDEQDHHNLETVPATQVFPDIRHQFVWDMDRFILTRVYPLGAALRQFPEKASIISAKASAGLPENSASTTFGYKDNRDFKGKIVTLTTVYLKDQPSPDWKTEEEAIRTGKAIESFDMPMMAPPMAPPAEGAISPAAVPGTDEPAPEAALPITPEIAPEPIRSVTDAKTGEPLETNDDGKVWHPSWGMRNVLRQMVFLERELIEDDICPWPRIPVIHAACVGVEDNPYGYGLPWGARHSQSTYSASTRSIDSNTKHYGNSAAWLPSNVHAKMEKQFGSAFLRPGDMLSIDNSDIPANGQFKPFIEPPEIPESIIIARRENKEDLDEIMGMQESLRGEPVTANASGRLQAESAQQAIGLVTAMSKQLQGAIGHLCDLMLHSIIHFTTVDEVYMTCRKVRKEVLAAIHLRHAPEIKWVANASLVTGAGMRRDQRRLEMLELNAHIDPASQMPAVDIESLQEAYNLDPEIIRQRNENARQQAQQNMMMQQQAMAAAAPQGDPKAKKDGPPAQA